MEQARARIDQVRKGEVTLKLLDQVGQPIRGQAKVRLLRHAFPFGAALSHAHRLTPEDEAYAGKETGLQAAAEILTMATVNCHWGLVQMTRGTPNCAARYDWSWPDLFLDWAESHGMRARMHALLYLNRSYTPTWRDEVGSTKEWWALIERHIARVAERYGDRIREYDVINEMFHQRAWQETHIPLFPDLRVPENTLRAFEIADKYLPHATLIPLESFIPTTYEGNWVYHDYYAYNRRLIELGAPLDAIGYQGHFYTDRPSFRDGNEDGGPKAFRMGAIEEGLDRLAGLGKPIHITEFNPPSRNWSKPEWPACLMDEAVAAWTVNYYTLAYSKPYIKELVRWFVVDAVGGRGTDAGLVTRAGERKPAFWALKELLQETWSTRWAGELVDGAASFHGFYGTYEVTVEEYTPARFELEAGGGKVAVRLER
jgi:GH35 family endo-1,4-beta-xylanase